MALTEIIELITDVIEARKRTSVTRDEIRKYVAKIMMYLIHFNTLNEYDVWILDRHIDEVQIPQEFKDFILPSAVRFVNDELYPDLLLRSKGSFLEKALLVDRARLKEEILARKREENDTQEDGNSGDTQTKSKKKRVMTDQEFKLINSLGEMVINYNDYYNTILRLYNVMKATPNFVTLKSLRKCVLLSDVIVRVPQGNRMFNVENPVVPLEVDLTVSKLVGTELPSMYVDKVMSKYALSMFAGE